MRALPLAALLAALSACIVVPARRPPPPPPPPPAAPAPAPVPAYAPAYISEQQAVDIAFRLARERGLGVDQVKHVHLDGRGRWHVELRGHHDRARVLLDARDGRVLRAAFRDEDRWED
jgi:peptidase YpeB-like protein